MPPTTRHKKRDPDTKHDEVMKFTPADGRHLLLTNLALAALMILAWPELVKGYN